MIGEGVPGLEHRQARRLCERTYHVQSIVFHGLIVARSSRLVGGRGRVGLEHLVMRELM